MVVSEKNERVGNQKNQSNEERLEVQIEEFIPYACHYDPATILTKNGELMQTIKITGFNYETVKDKSRKQVPVRRLIRQAVAKHIKTDNFALWIHTVRRKKDISTGGKYPPGFSEELHKLWTERHDWQHQYMNELYVTVIIEGESLSMLDFKDFLRSLYMPAEVRYREQFLARAHEELNRVVTGMLADLREYGPKRLEITKYGDTYYSDPVRFLSKIINLEDIPHPADVTDLSEEMRPAEVFFGYNALEVKTEHGNHFAALLTVKEYHDISTKYIDEFLQIPAEFVITETFDFITNKRAMAFFQEEIDIYRLGDDKELAELSGLGKLLNARHGQGSDFGEHQISIMLIEDELEYLDKEVEMMVTALKDLGIVAFREDMYIEDVFWAQLPANFEFIKRMLYIDTSRIAGYASLYNFPAGKIQGNHWGPAVTVFKTIHNTPYFFNFHYQECGHTCIIGPFGSGKTVLLNFLVSEARKFNPRVFLFDHERESEIFVRAIKGKYTRIMRDKEMNQIAMNPFSLPNNSESRTFLARWFAFLISDDGKIPDEQKDKITRAIEFAYTLAPEERKMSNVIPRFWDRESKVSAPEVIVESDAALHAIFHDDEHSDKEKGNVVTDEVEALMARAFASDKDDESKPKLTEEQLYQQELNRIRGNYESRLSLWYGEEGRFSHLFDNALESWDPKKGLINGFSMSHMIQDEISLVPVLSYILYRIQISLDGSPTMIVLDEAWSMIDHPAFAEHLEDWLKNLTKKNAIVVFATEHVENVEKSSITKRIIDALETKIFLRDVDATKRHAYTKLFGLTHHDAEEIAALKEEDRSFLIVHNVDKAVAKLNLTGLKYHLSVLSGSQENISMMEGAILDVGSEDADKWLPLFKQRVSV